MDNDEYNRLFEKAKRYAMRFGFGDEAEDFAQEYAIQCFTRGEPNKLEWALKDYSSKLRADKRVLSSPSGYNSKGLRVSLDQPIGIENDDGPTVGDFIGMPEPSMERERADDQINLLQKCFTGRKLEIVNKMQEGMTSKEIGEHLGCSESRISQLVGQIRELAMILSIVPEGARGWAGKNAFRSGKQCLDVLKEGLLEQEYRRKFIRIREDSEIPPHEHLQKDRS